MDVILPNIRENSSTRLFLNWDAGGSGNMSRADEKEYDESRQNYIYTIAFICFTLFVGVAFRELFKKIHFPYTALLFLFGCALGIVDGQFDTHVHAEIDRFDSRLMMHLFLPAIIYESAFSLDPHMFFMALTQCLLLAIPGVIFCTLLTGAFAKFILESYKWNWSVCFIFGAVLSATDPVAVVALLKECGISPSLTTIIEGESLLNDGTAIVLFDSLLNSVKGGDLSVQHILYHFIYNCGVTVSASLLIAMGTIALLRRLELDTDIEVTFTFCIAYLTYYTAEITLEVSGVLSVVVLGVCVSAYKSSLQLEDDEETTVHQFWQTLSFWANTLIFTIVGTIITTRDHLIFEASDIGFILATYVAVSTFRALMVWILSGLLKRTGYGFTWIYGVVLTWGGLRGAVGLALVLISQQALPRNIYDQMLTQVSGIIFLTLVVNAPTMRILLKLLGIGQITEKNVKCMNQAIALLRDAVIMTEKMIRMDKYLVGVDWMWVRQVTLFRNPYEKVKEVATDTYPTFDPDRGRCSECSAEIRITPNEDEIAGLEEESRIRVLQSFEGSVWNQLSKYGISTRTVRHLNTAVENAIYEKGKYVMADELIKKFLVFSKFTHFMRRIMMKLLDKLNIEHRQNEEALFLENLGTEKSRGFRKWCLSTYFGRRLEVVLYWVLWLNVIPIAGEIASIFLENKRITSWTFVREIFAFEIINGILALFYVMDAVVAIGALGCRQYFKRLGNRMDFYITVIAVVQMIIGIVLIAAYRNTYAKEVIYLLVVLSCLRLLRLFRVTITAIFRSFTDVMSLIIYNGYDFSIGFIVANLEIAKTANKILDYEPSVDLAQFTAENNVVQMLSQTDNLESVFPDVATAWKTHHATVYVLRHMQYIVEDMLHIYMIDENDAELLLEEIALKIKDTLCAPRYMPADIGIKNLMKNLQWVQNDDMVDRLMSDLSIRSYGSGDIIQSAGTEQNEIRIISTGIVQITGQNDGTKGMSLPNADSLWYFIRSERFCNYFISPETLGTLGYLLRSNCVTTATCAKDCEVIHLSYEKLTGIENDFGDLTFYMWRPIALEIAHVVLENEEVYENWTDERIDLHLEAGIFPDFQECDTLEIADQAISDMVLIQGRVQDSDTELVYTGPSYIPRSVKKLTLLDDRNRPRVILLLLRKEKYHSNSIMGWTDPSDINLKGLCLVHGIRRASLYDVEKMKKESKARRTSFAQAIGSFFSKAKSGNILQSDAP